MEEEKNIEKGKTYGPEELGEKGYKKQDHGINHSEIWIKGTILLLRDYRTGVIEEVLTC